MQTIIKQIISLLQNITPLSPQAMFAERIDRIRKDVKISATSSFRTQKRNAAVGGKINSKHLENLGIDVILDYTADAPRLKFLCEREGLLCLDEKDHFHIQVKKNA